MGSVHQSPSYAPHTQQAVYPWHILSHCCNIDVRLHKQYLQQVSWSAYGCRTSTAAILTESKFGIRFLSVFTFTLQAKTKTRENLLNGKLFCLENRNM